MSVVSHSGKDFVVLGARGDTEFGPFVSMGLLVDGSSLTLARRYIDPRVPRNKLALPDVVSTHCPAIYDADSASHTAAPVCVYDADEFLSRLHDELLPWQFDGSLVRPKLPAATATNQAQATASEGSAAASASPSAAPPSTNPHVAFFSGSTSDTNPHMQFARGPSEM